MVVVVLGGAVLVVATSAVVATVVVVECSAVGAPSSAAWGIVPAPATITPSATAPRAVARKARDRVDTSVTMPCAQRLRVARTGAQRLVTTSTMSVPASVGFCPIFTPAAWSASCLADAVPLPPETMAPAWPIFLPAGAVTPAM